MPKHVAAFLFLALCLAHSVGCSKAPPEGAVGQATGGPPTGGMPPALVKINTIRQERVAPEFRAVGNVRPRFFSVVASGSDGIVEEFPVEVGEYVKAGTILSRLRMESTDLEIAEHEAMLAERQAELEEVREPRKEDRDEAAARKQSADVSYATAERRLKELRALSQRGAANPTEVKDAEEALDAAEQNRLAAAAVLARISTPRPEAVQQAEARMMAQQKHVEFLKAEREKRLTKSPFDGFVVEEHTYLGQWLSKGAAVATIARLDEVEVEVQIDQQYIDQIVPGREVTLRVQGTGSRDGRSRDWPGKVASIVPRTNWQEGSRSFPVIIRMQNEFDTSTNPPTPALREGMMAEAAFLGQQVDGILVPKDAIVRTSRGAFIFVLNSGAGESVPSVRQVLVTQGVSTGEWIQVAGEDLAAGQKVVTEGAERLRAFQTVQILEPSAENAAAKQ